MHTIWWDRVSAFELTHYTPLLKSGDCIFIQFHFIVHELCVQFRVQSRLDFACWVTSFEGKACIYQKESSTPHTLKFPLSSSPFPTQNLESKISE